MKFKLALRVSTDPVTAAGTFVVASAKQAGNAPDCGQGWGAYGKRFGAVAADGFSDIMIGGAIHYEVNCERASLALTLWSEEAARSPGHYQTGRSSR